MRFLILCGHGYDGSAYDSGATGCGYIEATETIKYGKKVAEWLRQYKNTSVDVYEGNMYHFLFTRGGSYDFTKYDYVLECHLNAAAAASGHGTEIFVTTYESGITVEQEIMKNLKPFFTLRDNDSVFDGVKRYNWGVINAIKTQDKVSCALLELCFITNSSDMNTYKTRFSEITKAIAKGIADGFGLTGATVPSVNVPDKAPVAKEMYRVRKTWDNANSQVGAYEVLENAKKKADETGLTVFNSNGAAVYNAKSTEIKVNDIVTLSKNATVYKHASDGVAIPAGYKGKKYTVQQIDGGCLLLKELQSWVMKSECYK